MKLLCLNCGEGPIHWDDPERVMNGDADDLETPMTCVTCGFKYEEGMLTYQQMMKEREK